MLPDTPTVFVVDDDADLRASIRGLLKSAGLRSEGFETAEAFLQASHLSGPSCLILESAASIFSKNFGAPGSRFP